jgi:hypothetical protein
LTVRAIALDWGVVRAIPPGPSRRFPVLLALAGAAAITLYLTFASYLMGDM